MVRFSASSYLRFPRMEINLLAGGGGEYKNNLAAWEPGKRELLAQRAVVLGARVKLSLIYLI